MQTDRLIHGIKMNRRSRQRHLALVAALAVLTGGNVFWELREICTALTEDQLTGSEVHTRTAGPDSDSRTVTETPEVWETSFAYPPDAAVHERAALIAESQLGYAESSNNFIRSEDGVQHGYTRYGDWYGNPYGEWNTMFTFFCMYYAGVCAEEIPYGGNAKTWQIKLSESQLICPPDSEPARGSVILLDTDTDGNVDRTGILTGAEDCLTVIEGDIEDTVTAVTYLPGDPQIFGYVFLPEADIPTETASASEPEPVLLEFTAESPSGIQVSAAAAEGVFPADAVMTVSDVSREDAMQAAENLEAATLDAVAVDITFTDADGTELEPAADQTVQVQITLPEDRKLPDGDYALLHVSDEGEVQKVEEAAVSESGAAFIAESFSVYVLTSNGYTDKDQAITVNGQAVPNSQTNPYVITVGQELEVRYSGDYVNRVDQGNNNNGFTVYNNGSNVVGRTAGKSETAADGYRTAYFTGLNPGICRIVKITGSGNWGSEQYVADDLWVKVVAPDIYVKTEFEDKQIDRVKEYLSNSDLLNVDGYVPNGKGKTGPNGTWPRPYVLREGDEVEIYLTGIDTPVISQYNLDYGPHTGYIFNTSPPSENKVEVVPCQYTYDDGITALRLKGLKAGEVEVKFPGCNKSMWIRVFPEHETFDHADMEIADGGKYTLTKTTYENGHKITTVEVYDAFVSRVNHARLLDASGQPLALKVGNNQYEYEFTSNGPVNGDLIGDYRKIGSSGQTQYELTSAFGRPKQYDANDVRSVVFDVEITLQPDCQFTITDGVAGGWSALYGDNKTLPMRWTFDQQGIIDAMNKCPYNNGFDFTIRANAAYVDLKAVKELNGGTLSAGQYEFELLDENNHRVGKTVKNDADGNIVFLNQRFEKAGTYTYTIREVVPEERESNLIYATDQTITVDVTEVQVPDGSGGYITAMKAEMSGVPPTLINYVTYRLPETGGEGVLPYYFGGTAIISAALLLLKRKRKGAC